MSTDEIVARLADKGIQVERRALARDIEILCEWGFEVQKFKKKSYYYFVAYRKFDLAELELLVDLVQAANCLSDGKTKAIVEKIADLAGIYGAELLKRNVVYIDSHKNSKRGSIYSIDTLLAAITNNKKVSFLYTDTLLDGTKTYRRNGERYKVNPLELCCSRTDYYLVCYSDNHDGLADYRVDRMESVKIEEEERTPKKEFENFNVHKYRKQMFSMYSGAVTKVELLCENKVKDSIWDRFGDDVKLRHADTEHFRATVEVQVSKLFFAWIAGSQGAIRIESPRAVAEEFGKFVQSIKDNY